LVSLTLLMSACQASLGPASVASRAKKPAATASARPSTRPSTTPASVAIAPSPTPLQPSIALTGQVKMDASFVVASGGGNVVAAGGGNVIAAGGGNLIMVGGQVIAAGGGNVVASGGGNVVAPGGGNYRLAGAGVALGEMLPAKGMVVVAVSLRTGKPLGEAVLTDDQGRYTLHIPEGETGNVRVVAAVPGKSPEDPVLKNPKLQSELLTPAKQATGAAEQVVDDDRTLASRYFRRAFVGRLDELLKAEDSTPVNTGNPLLDALWLELRAAARDADTRHLPESARKTLSERMADNLISYMDLQSAKADMKWEAWKTPKDERSFDAFIDILSHCREAAREKLEAKETFFDGLSYFQGYTIRRPTDFGEFVVAEYLSKYGWDEKLGPVLASIGVDAGEAHHLKAAETGLQLALGLTLLTNTTAKNAIVQLMKDAGKTP
jgi:hypothetical protein